MKLIKVLKVVNILKVLKMYHYTNRTVVIALYENMDNNFNLARSITNFKGLARTQIPTNKNDAFEFPTFGEIAGVSHSEVQWSSLALEEPP
jgi:hypothetical protein